MAQFHDIWEIWIWDKLSTKSKSETIAAFLHFNNCNQDKYYFQTNLKEHSHLGKIGLNFGFLSPTKFVNHFSFFENLVKNLEEEHSISNKTRPYTGSFFLTLIHATLQNFWFPFLTLSLIIRLVWKILISLSTLLLTFRLKEPIHIAIIDVASLLTNITVHKTIELICNKFVTNNATFH